MGAVPQRSAGSEAKSTLLSTATLVAIPVGTITGSQWFLSRERGSADPSFIAAAAVLFVAGCSLAWASIVSSIVAEPYLDEIFHIPQAQTYCQGRFRDWDEKITTPPGLYLASLVVPQSVHLAGVSEALVCDARSLRAFNVVALSLLTQLAYICRGQIEKQCHDCSPAAGAKRSASHAAHTALNIGLFPLLFFFSGLYYTDVLSTAVVLAAYANHLSRVSRASTSIVSDALTVALGLLALLMRQTNVFWVAVYMGGLEAVHAVKALRPTKQQQPPMETLASRLRFFGRRYSLGEVHDLPMSLAWPGDVLYTVLSLFIAAVSNPLRVLWQIYPYITILISFAGFVLWNGGVVLGDKSNHVATIHLAQMLYIWPLFAFFSFPLFLPHVVSILTAMNGFFTAEKGDSSLPQPQSTAKSTTSNVAHTPGKNTQTEVVEDSAALRYTVGVLSQNRLLWAACLIISVVASIAIVRFNTIIHPFTLADNRHYMFYIFRYSIRRAKWVRYALVAVYTVSRVLVWGTWAGCFDIVGSTASSSASSASHSSGLVVFDNNPLVLRDTDTRQNPSRSENGSMTGGAGDSSQAVPTSTSLILLLATTLSLVTAPLVEPRYFIIPWVIWRLQVPEWKWPSTADGSSKPQPGLLAQTRRSVSAALGGSDARLWLETAWFLLVNLATGCIFLYRPYQWRAEDGTLLEQGRLQRFMW